MIHIKSIQTRGLTAVVVGQLLAMLSWFSFSAIEPLIKVEWGISDREIGAILAAFQAGYCIFVLAGGLLSDRFNPKNIMIAGMLITGFAQMGFSLWAGSVVSAIVFRVLAAVGLAGVYIPGLRYLGMLFDRSRRGKVYGMYVGSLTIGSGGSLLIIGPLLHVFGWRPVCAVVGLLALGAAIIMLTAPNTGSPFSAKENRSRTSLRILLRNPLWTGYILGYALHMWELYAFWGWIGPFLNRTALSDVNNGLPSLAAGLIISVGAVGTFLGGWLSDRMGRIKALIPLQIISVFFAFSFGWLMPYPILAVIAGLLYGVVIVADSPVFSAGIADTTPVSMVGIGLAIQQVVGYSVTIFSSMAVGEILDAAGNTTTGWGLAFAALGLGPLAAIPLLLWLHTKNNNRTQQEVV